MTITMYDIKNPLNPLNTFYVLSKGLNSGRPMSRPCSTCFIVKAHTETERNKLFGYTYILWKLGKFNEFQTEPIVLLKIEDYRKILFAAIESPHIDHVRMQGVLKHVVDLQNRQAALMHTIKVLKLIEDSFIRKCVRF